MPSVALAHDHLNQIGGAERVLKLLERMYPDAPLYTIGYHPGVIRDWFDRSRITTSFIQGLPGGVRYLKWYLPLMPTAIESLSLYQYDVVLSSCSALIKGIITAPQTLHVCYCHTPTRYLWSDTSEYLEELPQRRLVKGILPFILHRLRLWDWQAAQRVDRFIANSEFVRERIKKYYGRESTVIYPPVDVDKFSIATGEPENYYLLISRLRPYKKVDIAITAFNKMNIPLKIIGSGEEEVRLRRLAGPSIEFLGAVNDATKARYLRNCRALIHPQVEDAGITAIEAMASGRPVIAYNAGGVRETVKEGESGQFFNEQSWESLADTVIRFRHENFDPVRIHTSAQQYSNTHFQDSMRSTLNTAWDDFQQGKRRV